MAKAQEVVSATQCLVCAVAGHKKANCKYKDSACSVCSRRGLIAAACWRATDAAGDRLELGTKFVPKAPARAQQASSISNMMNMEVKQEPTPELLPPCYSQDFSPEYRGDCGSSGSTRHAEMKLGSEVMGSVWQPLNASTPVGRALWRFHRCLQCGHPLWQCPEKEDAGGVK